MRRLIQVLSLLVGLVAPGTAAAQAIVCPLSTIGWTQTWSPPLTSASYDSGTQLLYVVWNYTTVFAFSNVPLRVINTFSNNPNPVNVYNSYVAHVYHSILLAQSNNCPLLWENGAYLWTD